MTHAADAARSPRAVPLVDFVVIGAQKAASSTLYELLRQHPSLGMPDAKEVQFFSRDEYFSQQNAYLDVYRREVPAGSLFGLADVQIMYVPEAAARCAAVNPAMRAIAVLRHPVDRAYSAYWFARGRGMEPLETFEEALAREDERAAGTYHERAALTYQAHGRYAEQLERMREALGPSQLLVLRYEEVVGEPDAATRKAFAWLGVDPAVPLNTAVPTNPAVQSRVRLLDGLIAGSPMRRALSGIVPLRARYWLRRNMIRPLIASNMRPQRYPPMQPATRARLLDYFRPHNERLAALLGMDLSAWNR